MREWGGKMKATQAKGKCGEQKEKARHIDGQKKERQVCGLEIEADEAKSNCKKEKRECY